MKLARWRTSHWSSSIAPRYLKHFLRVSCSGTRKGAFTGAVGTKQGLFEVADGGTLFIDEIGELALGLQAKLLRVLGRWHTPSRGFGERATRSRPPHCGH